MNRRVIFFICSNGNGHATRCEHIVLTLKEVLKSFRIVFIGKFKKKLANVEYINEFLKPSKNAQELMSWEKLVNGLNIGSDDIVISDNLVEPAVFISKSLIIANHFWHEENTHFKIEIEHRKYLKQIVAEKPRVVYSRLFHKSYHNHCNSIGVGLFGKKKTSNNQFCNEKNVLICGGTGLYQSRDKIIKYTKDIISFLGCKKNYYGDSYLAHLGVDKFSFDASVFPKIKTIFTRATIGMLSDSLRHSIKPIIFPPDDTEMEKNTKNLIRLGLGIKLEDYLSCSKKRKDLEVDFDDFCGEKQLISEILKFYQIGIG